MAMDDNEQLLIDRLHNIDWFQFEKLVGLLYSDSGFKVERRGGAKADGGIDLIVRHPTEGEGAIQCKHWRRIKVGVKDVRELVGAMADFQIKQGVIVTISGFTEEARALAQRQNIWLYEEEDLVKLIASANETSHSEIAVFLADERKYCPKCESKMVVRTTRKGKNAGNRFWGCGQYPRCRATFELTEEEETKIPVATSTNSSNSKTQKDEVEVVLEGLELLLRKLI